MQIKKRCMSHLPRHGNSNGAVAESAQIGVSQYAANQSGEGSLSKLPDANSVPELLKASVAICNTIHAWLANGRDVKKQASLAIVLAY